MKTILIALTALTLNIFSTYVYSMPMEQAKKECSSLGFKSGTEKHGNCVLKLIDVGEQRSTENYSPRNDFEVQRKHQEMVRQQEYLKEQQRLLQQQQALIEQQQAEQRQTQQRKSLGRFLEGFGGAMMKQGESNNNSSPSTFCVEQSNGVDGGFIHCQ